MRPGNDKIVGFAPFIAGVRDFPFLVLIRGEIEPLDFRCIGSTDTKPMVHGDAGYSLPCELRCEAPTLKDMLHKPFAQGFLRVFSIWNAKGIHMVQIPRSQDLAKLALE
ncbi:MAG: hypothetical protein ACI8X5_000427 [Planctomycetota bacterium]